MTNRTKQGKLASETKAWAEVRAEIAKLSRKGLTAAQIAERANREWAIGKDAPVVSEEQVAAEMAKQTEREAKAREMLAQAAKLGTEAWALLTEDADEAEIGEAMCDLADRQHDAEPTDADKAEMLLSWREMREETEGD